MIKKFRGVVFIFHGVHMTVEDTGNLGLKLERMAVKRAMEHRVHM